MSVLHHIQVTLDRALHTPCRETTDTGHNIGSNTLNIFETNANTLVIVNTNTYPILETILYIKILNTNTFTRYLNYYFFKTT